jgi:hypothetical protein
MCPVFKPIEQAKPSNFKQFGILPINNSSKDYN